MLSTKGNLVSLHLFIAFSSHFFIFQYFPLKRWLFCSIFSSYFWKDLTLNLRESTLCSCRELNTCVRSWSTKSVNEVWLKWASPFKATSFCVRKRSYVTRILLFQIKSVLKWFTQYLRTYIKWSAGDMKKISHMFPGGVLTVVYFLMMFLPA